MKNQNKNKFFKILRKCKSLQVVNNLVVKSIKIANVPQFEDETNANQGFCKTK